MKASEIKRRKRGLDKRYGRICPVCGKPIRKPRRGPTARFCGTACRQAYDRRKRALAERKKDESAEQTVSQLVRQEEDYRKRADAIRKRSLDAQKKTGRAKGSSGFHACSNSKPSWNENQNSLKTHHPTDTWPGSWTTSIGKAGPATRNVCSDTTDTRAPYRDRKNKRGNNNNMSMNLTKLTNAEYPPAMRGKRSTGITRWTRPIRAPTIRRRAIHRAIGSAREPNSSEARSVPPHPAKPSGNSSTNGATHPTANTSETSN